MPAPPAPLSPRENGVFQCLPDSQPEREYCVADADRDLLLAFAQVAHGIGVWPAARRKLPEEFAGGIVERDGVAISSGGKHDAASGREDACPGWERERVFPLRRACSGVHRLDGGACVLAGLGNEAAGEEPVAFVVGVIAGVEDAA